MAKTTRTISSKNKTFLGLFTVTVSQRAVPRQKSPFPDNHPFDSPLVRLLRQSPGGYLADHPLLWTRRQGCLGQAAHLSLRHGGTVEISGDSAVAVRLVLPSLTAILRAPFLSLVRLGSGRHLCSCNKARREAEKALHIAQLGLFQCTCLLPSEIDLLAPGSPLFSHGKSIYTQSNE